MFSFVFTLLSLNVQAGTLCKTLDFDSSSKSRNLKEILLAEKANLTQANFGGKYLVLKAKLSMETLWFIADCETGKFFKPTLTGELKFNNAENTATLTTKDGIVHQQVWNGQDWSEVESKETAIDSSARFDQFKVEDSNESCKKLDYSSFHRASSGEANLRKLNSDVTHPNFGGHYLILKNELLFENLWLIADCRTGNFLPEILSGSSVDFKKNSTLLILKNTGNPDRHFKRIPDQWIELPTTTRADAPPVTNTLQGKRAKDLIQLLPNPDHHSTIEFKKLTCLMVGTKVTQCSLDHEDKAHLPQHHEVKALDSLELLGSLTKDFGTGAPLHIDSGRCTIDPTRCTFETH